jgi:peptidoglycan/LPS O-acetylase OafA/YrhL
LWTYATFTQNYVMAMRPDHVGSLWVGITWSLAVEEQFYLLFPLLVYALRRTTLLWVAIGCIVAAPVIRVALWELGGTFYSGYFPTPARMDSLMFGFVVACVIRHRASLELVRRFRLPLDVVGLALFVLIVEDSIGRWMPTLRFTSLSAMFAYGILRIFLVEQGWYRSALRSSFLVNVGLISYAWYMYHQAVNGLLHGMILHSTPLVSNGRELAVSCLVLLVSAALAAISTRYYERLFRLLGRRVAFASRSTVMAPAQ